jgi:hypothetical protein
MNRKKQIILSLAMLCLLITAVYAFYQYSRPHASAADKKTEIVLTADSLYAAFIKDETIANKKYVNKILEVKGVVLDVTVSGQKPVVFLNTNSGGGINCTMAMDSAQVFSAIQKNRKAVIKGKCSGFLMDVNLVDCVIK